METASRILEFDILRAVAILLIVFSHFPILSIPAVIQYWAAIVGVSLFLFISGAVLKPPTNIRAFYKRRALRIYPFYLAIMAVYVAVQYGAPTIANTLSIYLSPAEILINAVGLQAMLNVPSYGVLWFVGVILTYYLVYPLFGTDVRRTVAVAVGILAAFIILHQFGLIIPQMIYYWPVFVAGILLKGYMPARLAMRQGLKPLLFISRISYPIYLTHYLIICVAAMLLISSAAVVPVVNTTTHPMLTKNAAVKQHKNYTLYFITMAAPCPAGVKMEADTTAWARAHPDVKFYILPQESPQGIKYDARLSPTTVMLVNGAVAGRWVGIFDLSALDAAYTHR